MLQVSKTDDPMRILKPADCSGGGGLGEVSKTDDPMRILKQGDPKSLAVVLAEFQRPTIR